MAPYAFQMLVGTVDGTRATLHLGGELDLYCRDMLRRACDSTVSHPAEVHVTVDLGNVDFIDASGLRDVCGVVWARRAVGDPADVIVRSSFHARLLGLLGIAEAIRQAPAAPRAAPA